MIEQNKLERIFVRKGKFVNKENNKIKAKQLGESFVVLLNNYLDVAEKVEGAIKDEIKYKEEYSEANAYIFGRDMRQSSNDSGNRLTYVPITLFKI